MLQGLATGMANKAIARQLNISEHTVKFHVSSIFSKLSASSRTEAVTIAMRQGLAFMWRSHRRPVTLVFERKIVGVDL